MYENVELLEKFMKEFFDFKDLCKAGFFKPEMKNDYKAQAKRVCDYFGLKTVYEYRKDGIRCHISEINPDKDSTFITEVPSIYE